MPPLSRRMIRLAFLNCWLGMSLASFILAAKGQPDLFTGRVWQWLPAHVNLLLVGWMLQLSMGVAYWILPRLPWTLTKRGRVEFAIVAAFALNGGVWIFSGGYILFPFSIWLPLLGLALQFLGVWAFIIHALPRIRPTFVPKKKADA